MGQEEQSLCPTCGKPQYLGVCANCSNHLVFKIIRHGLVRLLVLTALTVPLYLFARIVAINDRKMQTQAAAERFERGQQFMHSGNTAKAIEFFRNAVVNDRGNQGYTLVLASALAASHQEREAELVLLKLREASPENPDINLSLARIAANQNSVNEAVRFYHHALYGTWPAERGGMDRRQVQLELIRFLLAHHENALALPELLALGNDPSATLKDNVEAGELYLQMEDYGRALAQFARALRQNKQDPSALAGAAEAEMRLGRFTDAIHRLEAANPRGVSGKLSELHKISRLADANDPMARRLGETERGRRMVADFRYALGRLHECIGPLQDNQAKVELSPILEQAEGLDPQMQEALIQHDPDRISTGLEMLLKMGRAMQANCGAPNEKDSAMLLIGLKHGARP